MAHQPQTSPDLSAFPQPITINPKSRSHKQTFIILHGRGDNGPSFGPALLALEVAGHGHLQTLPDIFPEAKFIFPTAPSRRVAATNRIVLKQWFDIWSLKDPYSKEWVQSEGLRETTAYIHELVKEETKFVGGGNVFLGGLSQGCAAVLVALLLWDEDAGQAPAACFGMCGWLPYAKTMTHLARRRRLGTENQDTGIEGQQRFDGAAGTAVEHLSTPGEQSILFLQDQLEIHKPDAGAPSTNFRNVPVFLGHGEDDEKVLLPLGMQASECLEALGAPVSFESYRGLGHWYSPEMLGDMVTFLQEHSSAFKY
ncbi:hypothetical protein FH972_022993 [Carpinus fangiana]|uniref:Phospholipase/carboxylesterase/thioesterase domain-containing protein n=1 Tax=Carpinus fangiana TaxID=176857 RepID=A0A5N6KU85_9ROSI|nr:hypothetical protein FH972_022993 [Carpinus fangiana]